MLIRLFIKVLLLSLVLSGEPCPNDKLCNKCHLGECQKCQYSYLDNVTKTCIPTDTVDKCLEYSSATECKTCERGFYLHAPRKCAEIPIPNCAEYRFDGPGHYTNECTSCFHGMKIKSGTCDVDESCFIDHCNFCETKTVRFYQYINGKWIGHTSWTHSCIECVHGFAADSSLNWCIMVPREMYGCLSFLYEDWSCFECKIGYYHSDGKCIKMDPPSKKEEVLQFSF